MINLEEKPEGKASTPRLNDPISESAAALDAYLSGWGAASPFRPDSALPYNGTEPAHPIITSPESRTSTVTPRLATYIVAALLFSVAVREGALAMRRMVFAESTISPRGEPSNLKREGRLPPPAISEDKAAGKPASAPDGRGAAAIATPFSSQSAADNKSQLQAIKPAQPLPAETKPWFETVKAFKQLFVEHRAAQVERWKPQ
jgi:hypothetical protein